MNSAAMMTSLPLRLTLACLAILAPTSAFAAAPFQNGDLLMGFRATTGLGAGDVYVVNIGQAAGFRDGTTTGDLPLGALGAKLSSLYGAGWASRTDLFWGIAGTPSNEVEVNGDPADTLYASKSQTTPGTPGTGYTLQSEPVRGLVATKMSSMQGEFRTGVAAPISGESPVAITQSADGVNTWRSFMEGGNANGGASQDFGAFSNIEAVPTKTLSLFRVVDSTVSTYKGYFAISSTGVVSFTPGATSPLTYASWATTNAPGQNQTEDYDHDGIPNGVEFFMGTPGNAFTAAPSIQNGKITWNRASGRSIASFTVQTSPDLAVWSDVSGTVTTTSVSYTLPTTESKLFVRLKVEIVP